MINSNAYDYINVLGKAADASWVRNTLISNNIANDDTPGYKRQDIDFESVLSDALGSSRYETMDDKVRSIQGSDLTADTYTDYAGFSYRLDGNNVDVETENVTLAKNQLKYMGLIQSITQEFTNLKTAMK